MHNIEEYVWSLDISTTNVGFALWNDSGKLIELKHLSLKNEEGISVENRDIFKANVFKDYCVKYREHVNNELNGEVKHIFVEAPLSNTPKNINTTALLLGFNGMARYVLHQVFEIMPCKITVHETRKLFCPELIKRSRRKGEIVETLTFPEEYKKDKKLYIWEKVSKLEPEIEWFYTRNNTLSNICFDMSDSYAVGYAGLKQMGIIK